MGYGRLARAPTVAQMSQYLRTLVLFIEGFPSTEMSFEIGG
jgi:hypothetical protein